MGSTGRRVEIGGSLLGPWRGVAGCSAQMGSGASFGKHGDGLDISQDFVSGVKVRSNHG